MSVRVGRGAVAVALLSGLLFGAGLALSGMTRPARVLAFLDVTGDWDPSLAAVMAGAIGVHFAVARWVVRRGTPLLGGTLALPVRRAIDGRLLAGAALFGVGWGIGGYCPGPALAALATGSQPALVFAGAMTVGWWLVAVLESRAAAAALQRRATEMNVELARSEGSRSTTDG